MSIKSITFSIPGAPLGKQRPKHNRYTNTTYTPKETKLREQEIAFEYKRHFGEYRFPKDCYIYLLVTAIIPIPKRASKSAKEKMKQWKILPNSKPDGDNILKLVADALNGIAYDDDKQIVKMTVFKQYGEQPSTNISIREFVV